MKQRNMFVQIIFVLLIGLIVLACGGGTFFATPTPVPTNTLEATNTLIPTSTATPKPTSTPKPTFTRVPTPAPIGETVRSLSYAMTVVSAKEIRRVYIGDYYYYAEAGQTYVEVIVKVSNLISSRAHVPWETIYIVEESGDSWCPNWGGYQAVKTGNKIDGSAISVDEIVNVNDTVDFEEDAFLRLIFYITKKDKTTILFGFLNTPYVQFEID